MYKDSIQARREIARNFTALNYRVDPLHWQTLCMGVNRDLQAKKMRPNVPVPSRRKVIPFLKMMHQETGSMLKAILAFGFDGPWTSSGGSFRLAREIGFDIAHYAKNIHHKRFLHLQSHDPLVLHELQHFQLIQQYLPSHVPQLYQELHGEHFRV